MTGNHGSSVDRSPVCTAFAFELGMGTTIILVASFQIISFANAGSLVAKPSAAAAFKPATMRAAVAGTGTLPAPIINFGPTPQAPAPQQVATPIRFTAAAAPAPMPGYAATPIIPGSPFAMVPRGGSTGGSSKPPIDIGQAMQMLGAGMGGSPYGSPYARPIQREYTYSPKKSEPDDDVSENLNKTEGKTAAETQSKPAAPGPAGAAADGTDTIPAADSVKKLPPPAAPAAANVAKAAPADEEAKVPPPALPGAEPAKTTEKPLEKTDWNARLEAARARNKEYEKKNGEAPKNAETLPAKPATNFPQCKKGKSTHDPKIVSQMFSSIFGIENAMSGSLRQTAPEDDGHPLLTLQAVGPKGKEAVVIHVDYPGHPFDTPTEFCQDGKGIKLTMDVSHDGMVVYKLGGAKQMVANLVQVQTKPGTFISRTGDGTVKQFVVERAAGARATASTGPGNASR